MIKVIYIDPNNSTPQVTFPLIQELDKSLDIKFLTSINQKLDPLYYQIFRIKKLRFVFFSLANRVKGSTFRQIIKIFEYPFNIIRVFFTILSFKPDIVHFNWFFMPIFDLPLLMLIRLFSKTKIVISMHNASPHENRRMEYFQNKCISKVDQIIVFSKFISNIISLKTRVPVNVIDHGNGYEKIINHLGIRPVFKKTESIIKIGFFGLIRHYKGVDLLIDAFNIAMARSTVQLKLIIKGDCVLFDENVLKNKIEASPFKKEITFENKYLSIKEMTKNIIEVDIVVLPYREASQSGLIYYYYELKKPIIATNVGGIPEYIDKKSSITCEPDIKAISNAILTLSDNLLKGSVVNNFEIFLKNKEYNHIVHNYLSIYDQL